MRDSSTSHSPDPMGLLGRVIRHPATPSVSVVFGAFALGLGASGLIHEQPPAFVPERPILQTSQLPSGSRNHQRDLEPRLTVTVAPSTSTMTPGAESVLELGDIFHLSSSAIYSRLPRVHTFEDCHNVRVLCIESVRVLVAVRWPRLECATIDRVTLSCGAVYLHLLLTHRRTKRHTFHPCSRPTKLPTPSPRSAAARAR